MPSEGDDNEENFIRACGFDYRVDIGSSIADRLEDTGEKVM